MDTQEVKTNENENVLKDALPENPTVLEVENSKAEKKKAKKPVELSYKDHSWLRKNHYDDVKKNFKTSFILQHKKFPGKVVELRAASAAHACTMIHWKPNQVRLLGTKSIGENIANEATNTSFV